jgi:hypothetical protein
MMTDPDLRESIESNFRFWIADFRLKDGDYLKLTGIKSSTNRKSKIANNQTTACPGQV